MEEGLKRTQRRRVATGLAVVLLAVGVIGAVTVAVGGPATKTQKAFGGPDARINTSADIRRFLRAAEESGRFSAMWADVSKPEATRIVEDGMMPAWVDSGDGLVTEYTEDDQPTVKRHVKASTAFTWSSR